MGELERSRLSEREKHLLELRQEKLSKKEGELKGEDGVEGSDAAADGSSLPSGQRKNSKRNLNPLGVADRPVFKRKRVKVLIFSCQNVSEADRMFFLFLFSSIQLLYL
jgi:hypothetical protein